MTTPRHPATLQDRFGRTVDYVRVSVTDQCDLRCSYCIPKGFKGFEQPAHWLTVDEITHVVRAFAALGTRRIRLTGGEPLLRKDLVPLVANIRAIESITDIALSTNATRLAIHAAALKAAGLDRLNVSLDSLRGECVKQISGSNSLPKVLHGLSMALMAGFDRIKINMVLLPHVNTQDVAQMLDFCTQHGFTLRLIESMPMGDTGRAVGTVSAHTVLQPLIAQYGLHSVPTHGADRHAAQPQLETAQQLVTQIANPNALHGANTSATPTPSARPSKLDGGGPARYWQTADGRVSIGVITPISQHFCDTCNRVRLSVDGTLYMCLGQEERFELRPILRSGLSGDALHQTLQAAIRTAIELKPQKHDFATQPDKIVRFMSMTGG